MDDLDHSIHIAENDWSSFYDESEECDLLLPSLACLDDSDLSDSTDLDQQETQSSPDATSCTELPEQLNQSGTQGPEVDTATGPKLGGIWGGCPGKNAKEAIHKKTEQEIVEETIDNDVNSLHKESKHDHSSDETETLTEDGGVQTASDLRSTEKSDRAGLMAEKERWFVTVNESPARRRGRPTSVKKKRNQNKAREGGLAGVLGRLGSSDGGEIHGEKESEQSKETQLNLSMDLGKYPSDGTKAQSVKSLNQVLEDDAAEAVQEAQHPLQDRLTENTHFQCSSYLTCDDVTENTGTNRAHRTQMSSLTETAASCERYKVATAEPSITSPLCQNAAVMPDDISTRPETPEPLTVTNRGSASARSLEDEHSHVPACSVADSLKTYAKTTGKSKHIYAISPFWDEMEKLTIDDILHVRKRSCLPSMTVQEKTMPNPTNHCFDCNLSDSSLMDKDDTVDSDYFTQSEESKSDCCGELLTSDFEEKFLHFVAASRNPSPNPHRKNQHSPSSYLCEDDSEGKETPVSLEDIVEHCSDNKETQTLTLWPRRKYNVQTSKTEDLSLPLLDHYRCGLSLSRPLCLEEDTGLKPNCSLVAFNPASFLFHTDLLDAHDQVFSPEIVEYFSTESEANTKSESFIVYNPEMFVAPDFNSTLCGFKDASSFSPQTSLERPIPIFTCSHPTVRDLTLPKQHCVFLRDNCEREGEISPIRLVSQSFTWPDLPASSSAAAAVSGSHCWKSLASIRKIYLPVKGSFCCRGSSAWMFPAESEKTHIRRWNPTVRALSEGKVGPDSSQVFRELEEQQEPIWKTKRNGMFSTVKQSDMCLVCIAFASWVLRSSDPEAADAWKAALLANVSALSAIQYLRQYMKRSRPTQDEI